MKTRIKLNALKKPQLCIYTIQDFKKDLAEFLDDKRSYNLAERTLKDYKVHAERFYKFHKSEVNTSAPLDEKSITDYKLYLLDIRKVKASTVNVALRSLRSYINWLISKGRVQEFKIKTIKEEEKEIRLVTDYRLRKLLSAVDKSNYCEYRDWVLINLLYQSGARISEALSIKLADINLHRRSITLRSTETKSRKSRVIFFKQELKKDIKALVEVSKDNRVEYLFINQFGDNYTSDSAMKRIRLYNERAGFSVRNRVTFHLLRHSFATNFLSKGGDVYILKELLGHHSVSVTQRYLHLNKNELREKYDNVM